LLSAAALGLSPWLAACSPATRDSDPEPEWRIVAEAQLTAAEKEQVERAGEARNLLFRSLLAELTAALDAGGPASAIPVCKERAPAIANEVSRDMGLKIGRTSHRLRNPENAPPAWAAQLVAERASEPAYAELGGGALGILHPIKAAPPCLSCHGEQEKIAPDVEAALARNYPSDRATGFRAGDLRGWFWIEVPAAQE
jgi:hypothetical protein